MPKAKDYTGQKFGRLTAIERIKAQGAKTKYKCACDCGGSLLVASSSLASGNTSSCGCLKSDVLIARNHDRLGATKNNPPARDLQGVRSGRLVATTFAGRDKNRKETWNCLCDCGGSSIVTGSRLVFQRVLSCGCLQKEAASKNATTHGKSHLPEYEVWQGMWQRCTYPKHKDYNAYKSRTPPNEWRDFDVFFDYMGPRPTSLHSIDRIDNAKPYGPGNCRWATAIEQANNKG